MYVVVRIKGMIHANKEVKDTIHMLNLKKINSCTIIHNNENYRGMLQKIKDFVTWGEISDDTLKLLLQRAHVDNIPESIEKLKKGAILKDITCSSIGLPPPRKGYKSIKKPYRLGGSAGYRGESINELIERMV